MFIKLSDHLVGVVLGLGREVECLLLVKKILDFFFFQAEDGIRDRDG